MSRRYGAPIEVVLDADGAPRQFTWKREVHRVSVIARWHLADRWWETQGHSDRQYYRLQTKGLSVFEVYLETAQGRAPQWILDRVQD